MSAKTINRIVTVTLALALIAFAVWWTLLRSGGDMDRAVAVLDAHERELGEILYLAHANPRLCFVSTDRPIDVNCPDAKGPHDRADYDRIATLMRHVGIDYLNLWRDWQTSTELLALEFRIFDAEPTGARGALIGVWHGAVEVRHRERCTRARRPGWWVCADNRAAML